MATLARALRRDFPHYFAYFSTDSFEYHGRKYRNHNNLLGRFDGTDGVKTGYTDAAGFNLVASVERNGRRLVGVVFGGRSAQSRDAHMRRILDRAFAQLERSPHIVSPERVPVPLPRPSLAALAGTETASAAPEAPRPAHKPGLTVAAEGGAAPVPTLTPAAAGSAVQEGWAVQLGAYSDYRRASLLLRRVAKRLPDLDVEAVSIEPLRRDGTQLYRARLTGLSELAARRACARLERNDLPCVPVAPDDDV
jgi:D-alanyl-D-alanine carboxypeptidase